MFVHSFQSFPACISVHKHKGFSQGNINSTSTQEHDHQGRRWAFSQRDLCQFSFHYSTEEVNPHYHNKLYFYRQVQTEAAFQGIRLNFIWPPVFLGNTVLLQLPHALHFIFLFGRRGNIWNVLLTQYLFAGSKDLILRFEIESIVIWKGVNRFIWFVGLTLWGHYCALVLVTLIILVSI